MYDLQQDPHEFCNLLRRPELLTEEHERERMRHTILIPC